MTADYNPTESARMTPAVARGLLLISGHFDDDGHNWTDGTEMEDFEAAYDWIKSVGPGVIADHLESAGREVERLRADYATRGEHVLEVEDAAHRAESERDSLRAALVKAKDEHISDGLAWFEIEFLLTAALRAIWPVYRAAVAWSTSDLFSADDWIIKALDTSRAAITPDILAAIKAAGLEDK